jgi:hypothetical protein
VGINQQELMMQEKKDIDHVIVCTAYGCTDVYPATKARALQFYNDQKQALPREVLAIAEADPTCVRHVPAASVSAAIQETFGLRPGEPANRLRNVLYGWHRGEASSDVRPNVLVQPEWGREIAYWLTENGLTLPRLTGSEVLAHDAWAKLSMFTTQEPLPREVRLVEHNDYLEMADAYKAITEDRWKEGASEASIARYILNFVLTNLVDRGDWKTLGVFPVNAS